MLLNLVGNGGGNMSPALELELLAAEAAEGDDKNERPGIAELEMPGQDMLKNDKGLAGVGGGG